ncbi:MAG TPA: 2TM domain-containing protein [Polyangiaceae bacterium]|nr:2TM domain-containing protein [Polyangiaceae bacterium]
MSKDQSYADDEVRAIIERALKEQPASGVSHEDLLSIGAGIGLSPAAVENAAREVTEARLATTATKRIVSRRRRGLIAHALVYSVVNALLFAVNFLTTPGEWWVLFPVFFWGLGLLVHAGFGLSKQVSERRLTREKQRLLKAAGAGVSRLVERRAGVRVAGPVDQIEANPGAAEAEAEAEAEAGERGQRRQ